MSFVAESRDPELHRTLSQQIAATVATVAPTRHYEIMEVERARLYELFGAERDGGRSLRPLLWSQTSFVVPAFEGAATVEGGTS